MKWVIPPHNNKLNYNTLINRCHSEKDFEVLLIITDTNTRINI